MSGLLAFLFTGEIPSTEVVVRGSAPVPRRARSKDLETSRFKLVYFFSWVLSITLILSLAGTIILKLNGRDDTFLHPIITGIIGYFGGAIAAYFGIRRR